jgi:hypothetical protein
MAWRSITVIPREGEDFSVETRFADGIPGIEVADHTTIQFSPGEYGFAIEYLNDLADKARALALQVAEATS